MFEENTACEAKERGGESRERKSWRRPGKELTRVPGPEAGGRVGAVAGLMRAWETKGCAGWTSSEHEVQVTD